MRYEWDAEKAAANFHKHRVAFADALEAIRDPLRVEFLDQRFSYGEERARIIGMARAAILFVVTTIREGDTHRIISARKATRHEQDRYYRRDSTGW